MNYISTVILKHLADAKLALFSSAGASLVTNAAIANGSNSIIEGLDPDRPIVIRQVERA